MAVWALIDLGSNSVRMDIVRIYAGAQYEIMEQTRKMVRLSENMNDDMRLKITPMSRAVEALKEFKADMERCGAEHIMAFATAGVRKAENKQFFIDEVLRETGIRLQVISGEQEAVYDFLGVMASLKTDDCLIVDTGGGSTELICVKNGELRGAVSIPMGAVGIGETFFADGENAESRAQAGQFVTAELDRIPWLDECKGLPIVGLGGSIRTLAKVDIKLSESDSSIHGYTMDAEKADEIYRMLEGASREERKKIRGVDKDRADIIVSGLLPVRCLIHRLQSKKIIISNEGLRRGMLFEILGSQYKKMLQFLENMEQS